MDKLKIFTPVATLDEAKFCIDAGAREIYLGCIDEEWTKKFHRSDIAVISPNRRPSVKSAFRDYSVLTQVIDYAHSYDVTVHYTLNSHSYSPEVEDYLVRHIKKIEEIGVDYVIVADLYLLHLLKRMKSKLKISVSGEVSIINSNSVSFFKKNFGITRVTFPQHITLREIKTICNQHEDIEFEVFIFRALCPYNGGTCHGHHFFPDFTGSVLPSFCISLAKAAPEGKIKDFLAQWWKDDTQIVTCGLCSLPFLKSIPNIVSLKLVGRDIASENKYLSFEFIKTALELAVPEMICAHYCKMFPHQVEGCKTTRNCLYYLTEEVE